MYSEKLLEEAVEYFKSNKGFKRMMEKMKNKYVSFNRQTPGSISVENPSKEEKDAISGFMKKDYLRNKTITISLKKFQQRLDETRFEGVLLKELIETYFGHEIISLKEETEQKQEKFNEYLLEIADANRGTLSGKILEKIFNEKTENYILLKSKYEKENAELKKAMMEVCKCINNLPNNNEKVRLPIFATKNINNPHGLDRKNLTGKLFINFLSESDGVKIGKNSEELSELYYRHNILIDDVSNMVLCKNIKGYKGAEEHSGWKGFFDSNEAIQATLDNLSQIDNVKVENNYAIVVENPAVFMLIAEKLSNKKVPLVCTYGQVKLSGIMLLNMLSKVCDKIYYSGDSDPEGIQIADKIKQRFKEKVCLIGFDTETYYKVLSEVQVNDERLKKLKHIKSSELMDVCAVMAKEKRVAYEERKLMDDLIERME